MVYRHRPLNIINLPQNGLLVSIYRVDADVSCQNRFSEFIDGENIKTTIRKTRVYNLRKALFAQGLSERCG